MHNCWREKNRYYCCTLHPRLLYIRTTLNPILQVKANEAFLTVMYLTEQFLSTWVTEVLSPAKPCFWSSVVPDGDAIFSWFYSPGRLQPTGRIHVHRNLDLTRLDMQFIRHVTERGKNSPSVTDLDFSSIFCVQGILPSIYLKFRWSGLASEYYVEFSIQK